MPRYECSPFDGFKTKAPALAVPATVARPTSRQSAVTHEVVVLPAGVDQRGDVFESGALAEAMVSRSPSITIAENWRRPVSEVMSAVELPAGDPPAGTPALRSALARRGGRPAAAADAGAPR